ncbi:MAG: nucleotidyltransferase family protein [Oscillospiraceae bacterium]|nr:nucleotidyltransferase family protein [Oscillospiraceae bacterium]
MKVSGIICEYNPFHNGHYYHIKKTRENGATHIVAIMSGNFVQRGDVAIIDKFERAKAAVRCGADLVIELPVAYSLSGAEGFARGAMYILNAMGCVDEVSFGSESGDINKILSAVQASIVCSQSQELRTLLEGGMSYPSAMHVLAEKNYGKQVADVFEWPNNLLAIEYLKAISYLNSKITPFTVTRKNAGHDQPDVMCNFASASFIRQNVGEKGYSDLMPRPMYEILTEAVNEGRVAKIENLEKAVMYRMRTMTPSMIRDVPDVGQGLEHRIFEARTASSVTEMMEMIKTKRYTMSRIRRILINALLGITKDDLTTPPVYGRILAVNERGTDILGVAKGKSRIPLSTSLAKLSEINAVTRRTAELESLSTDIYSIAMRKPGPVGLDYRAKIGITNSI